jgi:hypothetical protein
MGRTEAEVQVAAAVNSCALIHRTQWLDAILPTASRDPRRDSQSNS